MSRAQGETLINAARPPHRMRSTVLLLVVIVLITGVAAGQTADGYVNASGPAFLQPFGPHDGERVDNPIAAVVTAVVVAGVILNGLRRWKRKHPDR